MSELKYLNNSQLLDKLKNRSGGGVELVDTLPPATNYADGALILLQKNILKITDDSFTTLVTASEGDIIGFTFYDVSVDGETMLRGNPEVLIDWGDGTVSTTLDGDSPNEYYHTYQAGTYVVKLATKFDLPKVAVALDFGSAIDIVQFGDLQACGYQIDCPNLGSVPATLPVGVTTTEAMFRGCTNFNGVVGGWDTSRITNMYQMFENCSVFNQDLSGWDTSSVTNMGAMFSNCSEFNQNINSWDVSKVVDVSSMFSDCNNFDSPLNSWRLTSVDLMHYLFYGCTNFNQPLDAWTVGSATVMSSIFSGCSTFNQPLNSWDTSSVTDMAYMFEWCTAFNQPLNNWDVGQVEEMAGMFFNASIYDQDLSGWNLSFYYLPSNWDTGTPVTWTAVEKPAWINPFANSFEMTIVVPEGFINNIVVTPYLYDQWDYDPNVDLFFDWGDGQVFRHTEPTHVSKAHTGGVYTVRIGGSAETLSIYSATTDSVDITSFGDGVGKSWMLGNIKGLRTIPATLPPTITSLRKMFENGYSFTGELFDFSGWDTTNVTNMSNMFSSCWNINVDVSSFNTTNVTDMTAMFSSCYLINPDTSNWSVGNVTSMEGMFAATKFNRDLSGWDMRKVTQTQLMFSDCREFNSPLDNWDLASVTDVHSMFQNCVIFNSSMLNWKMPVATYALGMFAGCTNFNQPIGYWDVSSFINMQGIFVGCTSFNQNLNNWNVGNVTNISRLFLDCTSYNQPMNNWNTANVIDMSELLRNCTSFNQNLSGWNTAKVQYRNYFDTNTPLWSQGNKPN